MKPPNPGSLTALPALMMLAVPAVELLLNCVLPPKAVKLLGLGANLLPLVIVAPLALEVSPKVVVAPLAPLTVLPLLVIAALPAVEVPKNCVKPPLPPTAAADCW